MVGVGTLVASANEIHCLACGAKYTRGVPDHKVERKCPHCASYFPAYEYRCPECERESQPWVLHEDLLWHRVSGGEWQWLDEEKRVWRWYRDGTVSSPGVKDSKPSRTVSPSRVRPPVVEPITEGVPESEAPSASVDDLERLVALHERGALTDDEFRAAKANLLGL
jgi:hypothetical protein